MKDFVKVVDGYMYECRVICWWFCKKWSSLMINEILMDLEVLLNDELWNCIEWFVSEYFEVWCLNVLVWSEVFFCLVF